MIIITIHKQQADIYNQEKAFILAQIEAFNVLMVWPRSLIREEVVCWLSGWKFPNQNYLSKMINFAYYCFSFHLIPVISSICSYIPSKVWMFTLSLLAFLMIFWQIYLCCYIYSRSSRYCNWSSFGGYLIKCTTWLVRSLAVLRWTSLCQLMSNFSLSYTCFCYDLASNKVQMIYIRWLYTSEIDPLPLDKHSLQDATIPPMLLSVFLSNPKNNFLLSSRTLAYNSQCSFKILSNLLLSLPSIFFICWSNSSSNFSFYSASA